MRDGIILLSSRGILGNSFFFFFLISEKIGKKEKKRDGRAVVERILNLIVRDGIFWIPKNFFLFSFFNYRVEKIKVAKRS